MSHLPNVIWQLNGNVVVRLDGDVSLEITRHALEAEGVFNPVAEGMLYHSADDWKKQSYFETQRRLAERRNRLVLEFAQKYRRR
jgi:hypothetical protein